MAAHSERGATVKPIKNDDWPSICTPGLHLVLAKRKALAQKALEAIASDGIGRRNVYESLVFDTWYHGLLEEELRKTIDFAPAIPLFTTTMREAIVDLLAPISAEDARARILFADEQGRLCQMTEDETAMVWEAREAGIETLSEILLTRGLW